MKQAIKTITALTGLCIGISFSANAQWGISGNSNIVNTNFLGTTATGTFKDLIIKTNNIERIRVLGTGFTGIGTLTPLQQLHVVGNILVNGPTSNLFFGESATTPTNGEWGIEYESGGLNFWKPSGSNGSGNYFLFLKDGGRIGIGTNGPLQNLDVNGRINVRDGVIQRGGTTITTTSDLGLYSQTLGNYIRFVTNGAPFKFYADAATNPIGNTQLFSIEADGKVIIGNVTTPGNYGLYVQKGILTEKIKIAVANLADWSDYVFAKDYKLKSIEELDAFVTEHKHLPNVPSAKEVVTDGIDVAKMDAKLLEKIEELSLYIIQLKKENVALVKRVEKIEQK